MFSFRVKEKGGCAPVLYFAFHFELFSNQLASKCISNSFPQPSSHSSSHFIKIVSPHSGGSSCHVSPQYGHVMFTTIVATSVSLYVRYILSNLPNSLVNIFSLYRHLRFNSWMRIVTHYLKIIEVKIINVFNF